MLDFRYWDFKTNKVMTRYLDSQFFNRPNTENITNGICNGLKGLPADKFIHLSMDGPSKNWKVYELTQEKRIEDNLSPLENLGSCGLHSVSGALGTVLKCSTWPLKKVFKSMFNLFHDSPARRDIYMNINSSDKFPEKFCPTCWVANEHVAEVAVNVWDK